VHSASDRLPFVDGTFDVAFTACVFHHIEPDARRRWAAELARVVRPGGAVIVFEHNPLNPLTRMVVRRVPFDAGVKLLGGRETRRHLRAAGLHVSSPVYYGFFPRLLAALRPAEPWLRWLPMGAQYYVVGRRAR
jgi:SAM-dependent methyltransferase